MRETLLHTPEGVRDIYNSECKRKLKLVDQMHHILELYGYHDIETPTFEYFNIFNIEKGSAPSNEMYKFFDRDNNTLVLRPDITPSIARSVAKYYNDYTLPIRLSYKGNTFSNKPQHQGKLNETTQIGGELVNDDSSAADAEIIACVINCFLEVGLTEFIIEIGEIDYFKGLIGEAGLDIETETKIREFIQIKNFYGLSEYVSKLSINDSLKQALTSFDSLFGGVDMLETAETFVRNNRSMEAVDRMKKVYHALAAYGYEKYISFDLSILNGYNYYTGIVFKGYTYGTGDTIAKGGRYNNLLSEFGKVAPSVGFAIYVDELMVGISRNKIDIELDYSNIQVLYDQDNQENAIKLTTKLRNKDKKVDLTRKSVNHTLEEYIEQGKKMKLASIYFFDSSEQITIISLLDDSKVTVNLKDLV